MRRRTPTPQRGPAARQPLDHRQLLQSELVCSPFRRYQSAQDEQERPVRQLKRRLRDARANHSSDEVPEFTRSELVAAFRAMKPRGAPGPERIPPSLLSHLEAMATNTLLTICNMSLRQAYTPQKC